MDVRELARYLAKLDRVKESKSAKPLNVVLWNLLLQSEEGLASETHLTSKEFWNIATWGREVYWGAETRWAYPQGLNKALKFDGTSGNYVNIPNSPSLESIGLNFTIEIFLNPEAPASLTRTIIEKHAWTPTRAIQLRILSNNLIELDLRDGVASSMSTSTKTAPDDQWTHLVVTRDYDNQKVKFYFNGKFDVERTNPTDDIRLASPWTIGLAFSHANYKNLLDEIRLYNRILELAEIEYNANLFLDTVLGRRKPYSNQDLALHLHMDEGFGSKVYDRSGNKNNGNILGSATWVDGFPFPDITPKSFCAILGTSHLGGFYD